MQKKTDDTNKKTESDKQTTKDKQIGTNTQTISDRYLDIQILRY